MNLYMFYVGGNAGRSNIEVHDIQFVVGVCVEDCLDSLRQAWFGDSDKQHLDGYTILTWADGYDICLEKTLDTGANKLFFINAGAYVPHTLAEQHEFGLFVAPNAQLAKHKALNQLLVNYDQQHKDNLAEVDDCLRLNKIGDYYIHLRANPHGKSDKPAWQGYRPIGI